MVGRGSSQIRASPQFQLWWWVDRWCAVTDALFLIFEFIGSGVRQFPVQKTRGLESFCSKDSRQYHQSPTHQSPSSTEYRPCTSKFFSWLPWLPPWLLLHPKLVVSVTQTREFLSLFKFVDYTILSHSCCPVFFQSSVFASPSMSMTRLPNGPRPIAPESPVLLTLTEPQQFTRSTLSKNLLNTRYPMNLLPHCPSQRNKQRVASHVSWFGLETNAAVKMLKINRIRRQLKLWLLLSTKDSTKDAEKMFIIFSNF